MLTIKKVFKNFLHHFHNDSWSFAPRSLTLLHLTLKLPSFWRTTTGRLQHSKRKRTAPEVGERKIFACRYFMLLSISALSCFRERDAKRFRKIIYLRQHKLTFSPKGNDKARRFFPSAKCISINHEAQRSVKLHSLCKLLWRRQDITHMEFRFFTIVKQMKFIVSCSRSRSPFGFGFGFPVRLRHTGLVWL